MNIIYATYNTNANSIDIYTYAGYFLRIDCGRFIRTMIIRFLDNARLVNQKVLLYLKYLIIGLIDELLTAAIFCGIN